MSSNIKLELSSTKELVLYPHETHLEVWNTGTSLNLAQNFGSKVLVSQQVLQHYFFITELENTFTQ